MDVSEVKKRVKDKRIQEIMRKIDNNEVKDDDEWIQFAKEIDTYVNNEIPEDLKKLIYPLGYLEMTTMIIDGITRWRNSICIKCKMQQGFDKYSCSVYRKNENHTGGIPSGIWANEDVECPFFELLTE